jgi:hypothetical protein
MATRFANDRRHGWVHASGIAAQLHVGPRTTVPLPIPAPMAMPAIS